jgi:hypothetical protein
VRGVLELAEEPSDHEGDLLADVDGVVSNSLDRARHEHHRHRPLADVLLLPHLDGEREALLVEVVDDIVLSDQISGELDVPGLKGLLRLGACWGASWPVNGITLAMFTH